jgi:hypothetical protein
MKSRLTDKGLLAELLGLREVLLPLEQSKRLVDQGQHVHASGLGLALELNGRVELLDGLVVLALVEEQLAVVVIDVGGLLKVLHAAAEGGHGRGDGAHLVLRHTELDVREDEVAVEVDRLLVVLLRLGELALDEVELSAVVIDVGILGILRQGRLEVLLSLVRGTCERLVTEKTIIDHFGLPSSRFMLARLM